jgi:hypothetical protein
MVKYDVQITVRGNIYRGSCCADKLVIFGEVAATADPSIRNLRAFETPTLNSLAGVIYTPREHPNEGTPGVFLTQADYSDSKVDCKDYRGLLVTGSDVQESLRHIALEYESLEKLVKNHKSAGEPVQIALSKISKD